MLSIGLMSGTSMDGIDAALLETDGSENLIRDLGSYSLSYTPECKKLLKAAELAIRTYHSNLQQAEANFRPALQTYLEQELKIPPTLLEQNIQQLAAYLPAPLSLQTVIHHSTQLHILAVKELLRKTQYSPQQIAVIGYHGQTMLHRPAEKISVIVGKGQDMADELNIPVVTDFRSRDVQAGGQGAPLAPLYHFALTRQAQQTPTAVVNCGGIANLTYIPNNNELDLLAFDTGPGNGLIDRLVKQRTQGQENMDHNGHYGQQGKISETVLKALFEKSVTQKEQNYFQLPAPKALDIADLQLIPELDSLTLEDACATLEAFTAESIARSFELLNKPIPEYWILAGGGWNNPVIHQQLIERIQKRTTKPVSIQLASEAGWNNQALEAQIFAYFAVRSLQNKPLSLPGTTGVRMPLSGGVLFQPQNGGLGAQAP